MRRLMESAVAFLGPMDMRVQGAAGTTQRVIEMRTKIRGFLAIVAAFATVLTLGGGTAQAATCTVPAPYTTIQSAVNDSTCSTINVAPGLYVENVIINRTLTLNGAQVGNPAPARVGPESIVQGANPIGSNPVITINAVDVRIDGFTLKNAITTGAAIGIAVKTSGNGAFITNNIIDGVNTTDTSSNGSAQAIYLVNGPDNVRVLANDLKTIHSNRSAKGVHIGDSSSTNPSTGVLIEGNSIENVTSDTRGAYGVSINNGNGTTANSGLVVRNNTITNLNGGGWVHAIGLEANTPGVLVTGNTINPLVSLSPNDIVAVWFEANPSFGTAVVNENNFDVTIAAYGIAVQPVLITTFPNSIVDGTCNWWGDPNGPGPVGPGAGAKVTPNVDFNPWLTAPVPVGACLGGVPSTPGKVTGGGQIQGDPIFSPLGDLLSVPALIPSLADPTAQATFGFVVKFASGDTTPTGNLDYNDHQADVRIRAQTVDALAISGNTSCMTPGGKHATFTGTASVIRSIGTTTEPFTVDVDDCGEPGTMDTFGIKTTTYSNGPSTLIGGNIQIRPGSQ
jgi:hypothetical protein